ncbi:MAG: hypothetical protein U0871_25725 [Gemmataceae bacterium]
MRKRFRPWLIAVAWLIGVGGIWWWGVWAANGTPVPDGTAVIGFVPGTHVALTTRPADEQAGIAHGPFERWNLDTGECVSRDPGPADRYSWVTRTLDSRLMFLRIGQPNQPAAEWAVFDVANWRVVGRLPAKQIRGIRHLLTCGEPDAPLCAVSAVGPSGQPETAVFDIKTGERVRTLPGNLTGAGQGRYVTTTRPLPTTGKSGTAATVWDATDGKPVGQVTHSDAAELWGVEWPVALTTDGRTLVDRHGGVFDTTTGAQVAQLPDGLHGAPVLTAVGELIGLYLDGDHFCLRWFDLATATERPGRRVRLYVGNGNLTSTGAYTFDPDGRRVAVGWMVQRPPVRWAAWLATIHPSLARLGNGAAVKRSYLLDTATGETLLSSSDDLLALSDDARLAVVGGLNGRVIELPQRLPWAKMLGLMTLWTGLSGLLTRRLGRRLQA